MNSELTFHKEAAKSINEQGLKLLEGLSAVPKSEKSYGQESRGFKPDLFPVATLTADQIQLGPTRLYNPRTNRLESVGLFVGDVCYEFDEAQCKSLERLVESIQKTPAMRPHVSASFLESQVLGWIERRTEEAISESLSCFLEEQSLEAIQTFTVWVPLAFLTIEREVSVGRIQLRPISGALLDKWRDSESRWPNRSNTDDLEDDYRRKRSRLQGLAASTITLRAEGQFALMKGLEKAEQIASLIRCLHPANLSPKNCCYCAPIGSEGVQSFDVFLEKNQIYTGMTSSFRDPMPERWDLGGERLDEIESDLHKGARLLDPATRTSFQTDVLDSLVIYSRSTRARSATDKLVFMLVALESILLKSASEPIQSSVGERLAFTLGTSTSERRDIASLTRTCYGFRSKFIHHGKTLDEVEKLEEFMMYVWVFFHRLLDWQVEFSTKQEFIDALEERKFT